MTFDYKKIILLIGLFLIPFYEILVKVLPNAVVLTPNTRMAKLSIALFCALLIGLAALVEGVNLRISNKWLLALVGFLLISNNLSVKIPFFINNVDSSSFWIWKPLSIILIYFLMFIGVKSLNITKETSRQISQFIFYSCFAMSVYVGLQALGIDQFYQAKPVSAIGSVQRAGLVGNLGQPTIVAPFIAVGVIFALHLKKFVSAIFMAGILVLLNSKMALGGIIISSGIYLLMKKPQSFWILLIISIALCVGVSKKLNINEFNGRISAWEESINDWKTSPVEDDKIKSPSFTGIGLGSYTYLFHEKNRTVFYQAHNELVQFIYCIGLIGLSLFIMANVDCLRKAFKAYRKHIDWRQNVLITYISAFILLHLISLGTFVWQISTYQYLGIVLFGMLSNQSLIGEKR